jgi:hypothetical protein
MASRLLHEFLDALSADPALLQQYNSDPVATMTTFGLSDGDQQLLLTGSTQQIRDKLKKEMKDRAEAYVIRMAPQP